MALHVSSKMVCATSWNIPDVFRYGLAANMLYNAFCCMSLILHAPITENQRYIVLERYIVAIRSGVRLIL